MPSKHAIFLYELSGLAAQPWAEDGFLCFCYDKETKEQRQEGNVIWLPWDATDADQTAQIIERHKGKAHIVLGFPPCTDLAVSGAKHFGIKRRANPRFQVEAMDLVRRVPEIGDALGVPWALENPVSCISTLWRKPNFLFHPYEYGGYLPEDDQHPLWPQYINPRDAYPKNTCIWHSPDFKQPAKKRVPVAPGYSTQHKKLGGKSKKTKEIRSMTPRGFARAVWEANK